MPHMLIIDDEQASCRTLKLHFTRRGFAVRTAESADVGLSMLLAEPADVVISDIRMPGRDGLSLLREVRARLPGVPVIMITAFQDLDSTVAAMHGGAVDYVPKPIDLEELEVAVDRAIRARSCPSDSALVLDSSDVTGTIVGRSRPIKEVFKSIAMVSQSPVTVLILGESGTGKELIARAIHKASRHADQPFIAVNCAALVETLLESEMFGHERGAFTGAVSAHKGKVELAGSGTLFLDEVSELSPAMQGKLLRLLEEREFTPVGGTRSKTSQARFIAATNVDLVKRVADTRFREDLYYRLNVVSIVVPPLRERRDDIPLLVEYLLKRINREAHGHIRRVSAEAMTRLTAYDWPGNVRQLENVLMRAVVMEQGDTLGVEQLPIDATAVGVGPPAPAAAVWRTEVGVTRSLKEIERDHIRQVLVSTGWHKGKACEILGISRPRLERRIVEYGLSEEQ